MDREEELILALQGESVGAHQVQPGPVQAVLGEVEVGLLVQRRATVGDDTGRLDGGDGVTPVRVVPEDFGGDMRHGH
ncbi:MAG: hypothetical protein HZY75_02730 [Nocardioidaceae bacterium]|nr:MAG: hypothetical protein HZY75_02730 [Nocardioidaceae bacterium]